MKSREEHFVFEGENTQNLVFPLGGVGSGGLAITGNGRLVDWSLRGRPNLQSANGISHFALKVEKDGEVIDARVLNGPYEGHAAGSERSRRFFDGYGFGANRNSLAGMPHFSATRFTGRFPTAEIEFFHEGFPADVKLTAFSPFIPHNERDSGMPVALFEVEVRNTTDTALDYMFSSVVGNLGRENGCHSSYKKDGRSFLNLNGFEDATQSDGITLAMASEQAECMEHLFRGQWFDDLGVYWQEFSKPGPLPTRRYDTPRKNQHMFGQPDHGAMSQRFRLRPGESRKLRVAISWYFPENKIYWTYDDDPYHPVPEEDCPSFKYFYANEWTSAAEVADEALARWDTLFEQTCAFRDAMIGSDVPVEIIDASISTLALLRTQTVIRLEDGSFWAWEGQHSDAGSCEGSCTHVWNYQQALPFVFPTLERSLRETEFRYNFQENGGLTFRQRLPHGCALDIHGPCVDGHFGAIIKTYREWKLCGDNDWLLNLWPSVERAMNFAWSPDNPDRWDPNRSGVLTGRQHHTLDMELFGPNSWLSSFYVAALFAASEMAEALGHAESAATYGEIAKKGAARIDEELFNGNHYVQGTDLGDKFQVEQFSDAGRAGVISDGIIETYWSEEYQQLKYQLGEAWHADQILGLWHAELVGLPRFLDTEKSGAALVAIYDNNFHATLYDHVNPNRVYAYEDEGGLNVATWPKPSTKPIVPVPYSEEIWTGHEYAVASHLILRDKEKEALDLVRAARNRHDGRRRSPWNEMECGSYYARSMSAFGAYSAWIGLKVDLPNDELRINKPKKHTHVFWATGTGCGTIENSGDAVRVNVTQGVLPATTLTLAEGRDPNARTESISLPGNMTAGDTYYERLPEAHGS
ncbi:GH116 family glycosyl-hydrolase [Cognatishimia sp.]|uniref:GH116 family glycosyl-hydrolase n=1 Tax=Cognatishimia sp. TaxID=2211648 RepID=UPI003519ABA4